MWTKRFVILAILTIVMGCAGCSEKTSENISPGLEEVTPIEALNSTEWYHEGENLYAQGKYEEAIQAFDNTIKLDPDYVDAYYWKGYVLNDVARFEEALETYDKAMLLDPENYRIWGAKGNTLYDMGRYEEAIKEYDKIIELKPNDEIFYSMAKGNKCRALDSLDRTEEAKECYDDLA